MEKLPKGFGIEWVKAKYATLSLHGWPNVANNDWCIKTLVTDQYWNKNAMAAALPMLGAAVLAILF